MNTSQAKEKIFTKLTNEYRLDRSLENAEKVVSFVNEHYGKTELSERSDNRLRAIPYAAMVGLFMGMLLFSYEINLPDNGRMFVLHIAYFILGVVILVSLFSFFDGRKDSLYYEAINQIKNQKDSAQAKELCNRYQIDHN